MAASLRKKAELAKCIAFKTTLHGAEANVSASEMDVDDANRECDVNADTVDADDEDGDAHANERNPNPAGDKEDTQDAHICDAQPVANVPPVLATPPNPPLQSSATNTTSTTPTSIPLPTTHILGPDTDRFSNVSTHSIRGISALVKDCMAEYWSMVWMSGGWGQILGRVLERARSRGPSSAGGE
jgi:hypothetical protein